MMLCSFRWLCVFALVVWCLGCDEDEGSAVLVSAPMDAVPRDDGGIDSMDASGSMDTDTTDMMQGSVDMFMALTDQGPASVVAPNLETFETFDLVLSEPLAIQPSLAWGKDGALGIAWCGMTEDDLSVWFGLWDDESNAVTVPYILATATEGLQNEPAVCALKDGGYAVAWSVDSRQQPTNLQVRFRVIGEDGQPRLADDVRIGRDEEGNHWLADVACSPNGGFTVVGTASEDNGTFGIFAQHFNADGTPASDKNVINHDPEGNQVYPTAATDAAGRTLVVWEDRDPNGMDIALRGRWIDSAAEALGDAFRISDNGSNVAAPAITINDDTGVATVLGVQNQRTLMVYTVDAEATVATARFSPPGGLTYHGQAADLGALGQLLLYLSGTGPNVDVRVGRLGPDNIFESETALEIGPLPPYTPSLAFDRGRLAIAWTRRGAENAMFLRLALFE